MSIKPISQPLPGERVVALSPETAAESAMVWLARPNLFPGRALTAPTLQRRQRWQAGRLALRGQLLTPGVSDGLEVGYEMVAPAREGEPDGIRLTIGAGRGLAANGETVALVRPLSADLRRLPVFADPAVEAGLPALPDAEEDDGQAGRPIGARAILNRTLGDLFKAAPGAIPSVGVLVLQPVAVDRLGEFDPTDPCELCPCGEPGDDSSFEDWRLADGVRLAWYAWPAEWPALPGEGASFRNTLAWRIFAAEAGLPAGALLPWEELGVPIALIALRAATLEPLFIDRASVVRRGGLARAHHPVIAGVQVSADWRSNARWQAQIEQLAEQIAEADDPFPSGEALAKGLAQLPPTGLLPTSVIDLSVLPFNAATEALRSTFFPASFELDAVPVPIESLELAIREAAPLAPISLAMADRVRILVPVPQALFEPRLLYEEIIDPEFKATLDRFVLARAAALGARQGLRTKISKLVGLATGRAVPIPALGEDPQALESESIESWGPPPAGGGHRGKLAPGRHQHFFTGATKTMPVRAGDGLYAWAYLDPDNPPRVLMLQWNDGTWEHRAYWAAEGDNAVIDLGTDATASRLRRGGLPQAGRWVRLDVPDAATVGLAGKTVSGIAFTLHDGQAAFGATGWLAKEDGAEKPWFSNVLPTGALMAPEDDTTDAWTFLTPNDLNAPFEPDFGLEIDPQNTAVGRSAVIDDLLNDPALAQTTFQTTPKGQEFTGGVLSASERSQLAVRGLDGFIAFLKARADRADDLIDYGFIKVQSDTYRVRQLILGTTAATRLAVSPALTTIAQTETAAASQARISTFFNELKNAPAMGIAGAEPESPGGAAPPSGQMLAGPALVANIPAGTISASSERIGPLLGSGKVSIPASAQLLPASAQLLARPLTPAAPVVAVIPARKISFTPSEVANAEPLIGKASVRTTTIAKRLDEPKAREAKDYSTSTRHDSLRALLQLADQLTLEDHESPGLFAGINVYGLENDPFLDDDDKPKRFAPFAKFVSDRSRLGKILQVPDRQGDESAYFSDSADVADNTIALLRQIEGRVKVYRDAIDACRDARIALQAGITGAQASLAAWEDRLAEARHDVAVTRALIGEENERIAAINVRRGAVLQDVRFLAYIRPRETSSLMTVPTHNLDPGLLEAPVPACLRDHADVPDELTEMMAVLREAPGAWFVAVPKLIEKLDRTDLLVRTVQTAQLRSQIFAVKAPVAAPPAASPAAKAISLVKARQYQSVQQSRQVAATIDVSRLAVATWQDARNQVQEVVSLGDLIDGEHGRGEISRRAAEVFDQASHIVGCLHAEFSAVLPSIRLDWAERLSQFDEAPRLRDLSVLPRWAEIDYIDRRQMQGYVDWLFGQMAAKEPRADSLMNDVVRMCLLLAADAPIGRILAGRLPRPVVARPGVNIALTAFDPAKLRIGMQALVYKDSLVVARAVVEDIGNEVSARVIHTATAQVSLDVTHTVHFAETAQVTLSRPAVKQQARALLR